jgi:OFA family oxalate/formate antiporter-like MFS transporter
MSPEPGESPPLDSAPLVGRTAYRWLQLGAGVVAMVAVANFQYGWTLFVEPIHRANDWDKAAIQVALTLFILAETWLVPLEGYLADRFGPRRLIVAGGLLGGLSWVLNSGCRSLPLLYTAQIIGGAGAGMVYGTSIGCALKWFPDRRGLAAGLMAAAFGTGSALTVVPIQRTIEAVGYRPAFLWFGLGQGLIVLLAAPLLRFPRPGEAPAPAHPKVAQSARDSSPLETVRAPIFWVLYVMMTLASTGGVMVLAQIDPMARDLGIADVPVSLVGITLAALPFAMMLDRITGGVTRPIFGWVSDHVGREPTMFLAFLLEGLALLLLGTMGHDPVWFVILSGVAFFGWGAVFSLFPAITGDLFGRQYATTNYSLLYTAKGAAALLVPLGSLLFAWTGTWKPVFLALVAFDWVSAFLALFVLRRMRERVAPRSENA